VIAPLPVGVIGVGSLGAHHLRHLLAMPGVRVIGIHDPDQVRAKQAAQQANVRCFPTSEDLLGRVEAVTVAAPTAVHADIGVRALSRGVAVLMEKPLATTLPEADALLAAAERRGVLLQVGHVERFNRAVRAVRPHLDDPRYLEGTRLAPFQLRGTDVPVVLDLMIHDLDLILHLGGGGPGSEPVLVRANGMSILTPTLDVANAWVEFAGGAVARTSASRLARTVVRQLRIWQPTGYFSLDLLTGQAELTRLRSGWDPATGQAPASLDDVSERVALEAAPADALALELGAFVRAVRDASEPVVTGAEGRAALALALRVTSAIAVTTAATPVP